jgi:hypothetical protein
MMMVSEGRMMRRASEWPADGLDDPVFEYLLRGEASSLHEAEELYLNAALPEVLALLGSPLSDGELMRHPLLQMLLAHGSRGWEDSVL